MSEPKQAGEALFQAISALHFTHNCPEGFDACKYCRVYLAELQAFRELLEAARDVLPDRHVEQIHIERLRMVVARFDAKDGEGR